MVESFITITIVSGFFIIKNLLKIYKEDMDY